MPRTAALHLRRTRQGCSTRSDRAAMSGPSKEDPMTRGQLILVLAVLLVPALAGMSEASEFCNSGMVKTWLVERDGAAVSLVKTWLRGAPAPIVQQAGMDLVRWEVLLAPCAPPLRMTDFFLQSAGETDPAR